MLKNNSLLSVVYGVLFFLIVISFLIPKFKQGNDTLLFSYPEGNINFAGEVLDISETNYLNKERFDKEFLNTSNNLYQFFLYVKRFPVYIPYIEEKLKENGIPDDFKYLVIAESALRNDVISSAGAAGIWQFIPETAQTYGLLINEYVDERYHFEKATDAAMKYLLKIHEDLGDWTLTAAAYNRGENGIMRDLESQGVDNYYDLYLNEETSRYVFRILAIKYAFLEYFQKQDFINTLIGGVYSSPETKNIHVGKIEDLMAWSKENGYIYQEIKNLNQWILGDELPEGDWEIKVPKL